MFAIPDKRAPGGSARNRSNKSNHFAIMKRFRLSREHCLDFQILPQPAARTRRDQPPAMIVPAFRGQWFGSRFVSFVGVILLALAALGLEVRAATTYYS